MFLLGHAFQLGLIPVSLAALEKAIELNGVAVKANLDALRWGRLMAADPDKVVAAAGLAPQTPATAQDKRARYAAFLTAYQDRTYAEKFLALVRQAEDAERRIGRPDAGFAAAVAASAFKLMAYKDEYEVARLQLDPSFKARLAATFEGDAKLRYHLAPPLLARTDPRTGHPKKMAFGRWIVPLFRLLAAGRRLRGSPFDLFGYTAERRMERQLIADYFHLVERLCAELSAGNHGLATEIAALPQEIRGYGYIKQAAAERTMAKQKDLLRRFEEAREMALAS